MTLTLFVGIWLASYRLTRFVGKDSLVDRQRGWFYLRFPPDTAHARLHKERLSSGKTYWAEDPSPRRKISKLGQLVSCPWCIGFWLSGLVVLLVVHWTSVPLPILWWLATSSAVGLTAKGLDA